MTEKRLKEILKISEWTEIDGPDKFFELMRFFCELAPGVRNKLLSKMTDIKGLSESFMNYCNEGIVEYEPSVTMELSGFMSDVISFAEKKDKIKVADKRNKLSNMLKKFSEWFSYYGEVQCTVDSNSFICNVADAIKIGIENEESDNKSDLSMLLLNNERINIMNFQNMKDSKELEIDLEMIAQMLSDEAGIEIDIEKTNKYLM